MPTLTRSRASTSSRRRVARVAKGPIPTQHCAGTRPARGEGKLETVLHRVEGPENFWDISRMYYSFGPYYKALWKANEDKVPEITKLHQGTVIRIPPPEDLDPAYIDPPGSAGPEPDGRRDPRPAQRRG